MVKIGFVGSILCQNLDFWRENSKSSVKLGPKNQIHYFSRKTKKSENSLKMQKKISNFRSENGQI